VLGDDIEVGRCGVVVVVVLAGSTPAFADLLSKTLDTPDKPACEPLENRWPELPADHNLSLEDQITDHLTELGNMLGNHMTVLSDNMMALHVDGRHNRARLRVGGGNPRYLDFKVDSDWLFADGKARVKARLELGLAGHEMELKLPDMDLSHDNYHGQDLVQVNVSVLERKF
jgi:hypothetical protein